MANVKRLFKVDVDFQDFARDVQNLRVVEVNTYSIVESFVLSFDQAQELVQFLCVSRINPELGGEIPEYSQAVFDVDSSDTLHQITTRRILSDKEYYSKLLSTNNRVMENKLRLDFSLYGVQYALECQQNRGFSLLQVKYDDSLSFTDEELLSPFGSFIVQKELHMTIEEAFYRQMFDKPL